jgi:26S proteasome regulatory subunit T1
MPSATGQSWEKYQKKFADDEPEEKKITPLSDEDIQVLKTYGAAPYAAALKKLEKEIKDRQTSVNEKIGVKVPSLSAIHSHTNSYSCPRRSQTQVSPLRIFGILPPIDNA